MVARCVVGVDPALNGAAVLLVDGRVAAVWTWKSVDRSGLSVFRLAAVEGDRVAVRTCPTLGQVGAIIAEAVWRIAGVMNVRLIAEGTHVRFVAAAISVEGSAGRVLGPLEQYAEGLRARRVKASAWRSALLRMGHWTGRDAAKLAAARFVPPLVPGLAEHVATLQSRVTIDSFDPEHIYDAAGVAACGLQEETWESLTKPRSRPSSKSGKRGSLVRSGRRSAGSTPSESVSSETRLPSTTRRRS